jgi:hypothetical protein
MPSTRSDGQHQQVFSEERPRWGLEQHIWWVGPGKADAHYVAVERNCEPKGALHGGAADQSTWPVKIGAAGRESILFSEQLRQVNAVAEELSKSNVQLARSRCKVDGAYDLCTIQRSKQPRCDNGQEDEAHSERVDKGRSAIFEAIFA